MLVELDCYFTIESRVKFEKIEDWGRLKIEKISSWKLVWDVPWNCSNLISRKFVIAGDPYVLFCTTNKTKLVLGIAATADIVKFYSPISSLFMLSLTLSSYMNSSSLESGFSVTKFVNFVIGRFV